MQKRSKGPEPWLPPADRPARILIVRLSALGDVLHALPVLAALRTRFPDAELAWAVEDRAVGLLEHRTDLDRILPFPRKALSGSLKGLPKPVALARTARGFVKETRAGEYDLALDLQGNLKSGAVTRASGARLRFGLGGREAKEGNQLFTQRRVVVPDDIRHRVERNLAVASAAIGETLPYQNPDFPTAPAEDAEATRLLEQHALLPGGYVVLHPGTSGFGAFKRWPTDRWAALARRLGADGHALLVTYGPDEQDLADAVAADSDGHAQAVTTSSLGSLAALIRGARLFVAADTGPLHLASLVGAPLLGLFGPKDPTIYGPYGVRADGTPGVLDVITQDDVACRPCTLRKCGDPLCMTTLAPDRVLEAVHVVLDE